MTELPNSAQTDGDFAVGCLIAIVLTVVAVVIVVGIVIIIGAML